MLQELMKMFVLRRGCDALMVFIIPSSTKIVTESLMLEAAKTSHIYLWMIISLEVILLQSFN